MADTHRIELDLTRREANVLWWLLSGIRRVTIDTVTVNVCEKVMNNITDVVRVVHNKREPYG